MATVQKSKPKKTLSIEGLDLRKKEDENQGESMEQLIDIMLEDDPSRTIKIETQLF